MYKDKEKQKEANRGAAKRARDKRHTHVIPNAIVIPIPLRKYEFIQTTGMESIVVHYDPTLVAQALSSYAQPAHWAKAP